MLKHKTGIAIMEGIEFRNQANLLAGARQSIGQPLPDDEARVTLEAVDDVLELVLDAHARVAAVLRKREVRRSGRTVVRRT